MTEQISFEKSVCRLCATKIVWILVGAFLSSCPFAFSQIKLTGRVIDENSKALALANVVLVSKNDSSYISGTTTNDDGIFMLSTDDASCLVRVSTVAYITRYIEPTGEYIGDIIMSPDIKMLGEVVIKAERPQFTTSTNGISVDVQNSLLKQAGTADDVLSQLPRVTGTNGNFTVFGKGNPVIYINNRKIINPSELSNLKSSDIKHIELITNPGSQYAGNVASVIRITTIRNTGEGWGGTLYSFGNFSRIFSPMESLNLKYSHNRLEIFGNFSIQSFHNRQYTEYDQVMSGANIIHEVGRDTIFNNGDKQIMSQFGFNFDINKRHSMGLTYSIIKSLHGVINAASASDFTFDDIASERIISKSAYTSYHSPDNELDLYYTGKVGMLGIDFNATYFDSKQTRTQTKEENSSWTGSQVVDVDNISNNNLYAGKLILSFPIKIGKLSLGTECSRTKSIGNNNNAQNIFDNTETEIDERNVSGFAEYNMPLGDFNARTGIRYEHVVSEYYSKGVWQAAPSRKYSDWFPSLTLSWNHGKWQAQFGYNAKTARPSYRNLSSWMQYDNRYEYQGGNPSLQPAIIQSIELTVTRLWMLFTIGYKDTKNIVAYVMRPYADNIFIKSYDNIDRIQNLYASLVASPKFGVFQPMCEVRITKQFFDDDIYGHDIYLGRPGLSLRMNNRFAIKKDFTFSVNLSYNSSYANMLSVYKDYGSLDVNIYKSFLNNKVVCYLWGRDLLRTQNKHYTMYGNNSTFTTKQDVDSRCISIGVRFNFNATKRKYKGTGAGYAEKERL